MLSRRPCPSETVVYYQTNQPGQTNLGFEASQAPEQPVDLNSCVINPSGHAVSSDPPPKYEPASTTNTSDVNIELTPPKKA
jgi:hypothetical protein